MVSQPSIAYPFKVEVCSAMGNEALKDRIDPRFEALLDKFDLDVLESEPGAVFGLWPGLRLCYMNPGWFRFAKENEGDAAIAPYTLGSCIEGAIGEPLRYFYTQAFKVVFTVGTPWSHDYECSSPTRLRYYHQSVYPLSNREAVVVVNSLRISRPHDAMKRPAKPATEALYRDHNGFIAQCSHCRRVQRVDHPTQWDWVPAWVKAMPANTSHSLCHICYDYYYKDHNV